MAAWRRRVWLCWCVPQHDLRTINHTRTTGPVVFIDSLLMVHPWQHADGLSGFGVDLNTILEWSTTRVQWVRLNSLILCWLCIHGSMLKAYLALVWTSTRSWNDQPHAYNGSGCIPWFSVGDNASWQHADGYGFGVNLNTILELSTTHVQRVWLNSLILCWWCIHGSTLKALSLVCISTRSWNDQPHV